MWLVRRGTEFLILFNSNSCKLNSHVWLIATILDSAAIERAVRQEYPGGTGRGNRKPAVQLVDDSGRPRAGWAEAGEVFSVLCSGIAPLLL